ncbi:MAG: SMC-Scp complex subunit ScpB [Xanthomonadales bacterium]|nr:SMC-Scp complex subunit ScpB [Xanthomonadales bacterium]
MEHDLLKRIIEAALLAAGNPLSTTQLLALFAEDAQPAHDDVARALAALQADCDGRGVELVEVASGFRYQVRTDVHAWVARLWTERQSRYSRALLETLALIAYRQPITRGEIEQIRGVAVSTHIVKTLEERDWVRVVGHRDVPGKPALLGTTRGFLDYFNLKSLDELPSLGDIRDIDDIDPQLALGPPGESTAVDLAADAGELAAAAQAFVDADAGTDPLSSTDAGADDATGDEPATPESGADEGADTPEHIA